MLFVSECEEHKKSLLSANVSSIGQYVPQCEVNGDFSAVQCDASTGFCWCVDREFGEEMNGTRVRSGEGKPICGGKKNLQTKKCETF